MKQKGWAYTPFKTLNRFARFNVKTKGDEVSPHEDKIQIIRLKEDGWRLLLKIKLDEQAIARALMLCNDWICKHDTSASPVPYIDIKTGVLNLSVEHDYFDDEEVSLLRYCGAEFREKLESFQDGGLVEEEPQTGENDETNQQEAKI